MQYGLKYSGTRFLFIENSTELLYFLMDVSACFKTGNYFEWKNTTIFGLRGNTLLVYLHNFFWSYFALSYNCWFNFIKVLREVTVFSNNKHEPFADCEYCLPDAYDCNVLEPPGSPCNGTCIEGFHCCCPWVLANLFIGYKRPPDHTII